MCVAIVLPPKVVLDEDVYRAGFVGNPDGAGFAYYVDEDTPVLRKGYFSFKDFYDAFTAARQGNLDKTFLVHFRAGTMGEKSERNCHPFQLKDAVMMHNGHINGLGLANCDDSTKSDTHHLADLLSDMPIEGLEEMAKGLTPIVSYNSLTFLTKKGEIVRSGTSRGDEYAGAWFSNMFWKSSYRRLSGKREPPPLVSESASCGLSALEEDYYGVHYWDGWN